MMVRRKINSTAPPDNAAAQLLVPTEPPVPGVKLELGTLLIEAIKAQRKFLSKSSSLSVRSTAFGDNNTIESGRELLQTLQDTVHDKTTTFINELKRSVLNKKSSSSSAYSSVSYNRTNNYSSSTSTTTTDAPVRCFEFLLDILSNNNGGTNTSSFHLRRSALSLSHEILIRSRDARSYFARGQCLLDFVRIIEGVEYEQVITIAREEEELLGRDGDNNDGGRSSRGSGSNILSPSALFQLEAIELVHELASKYGNIYTEFIVASRLLGDISTNFTMQHHQTNSRHENSGNAAPDNADSQQHRANNNARMLRNERNTALECGQRACQILERMIERADMYFRILVPRFGGFNTFIVSNYKSDAGNDTGDDDDDDDDDINDGSIDWEEGNIEILIDDTEHNIKGINNNDHQAAVSHTLAVMERSGAILEGALAIRVHGDTSEAEVNLPAIGQDDHVPDNVSARKKLHNLVVKLSHRLSRMNQWIFALSSADGMEERTVIDPITSRPLISLVLLSEEKRAIRSMLLQRMMKVRGEIEGVLRSSSKLGIFQEESHSKVRAIESEGISASVNRIANDTLGGIKRPSLPPVSKRKKAKIPRINVIYRKT
jgi:hypothetical protein